MKNIYFRNKAFTLIELLVVISIIGLLSSIVLVNTRGSREKARVAKGLEFSQTVHNSLGSEAVGMWNFDNCTAQDASGYGNNGTISGTTCSSTTPYSILGQSSGKNSLSFDGVNDYVLIPTVNELQLLDDFTISGWIYPTNGTTNFQGILCKGSANSSGWNIVYNGSTKAMGLWLSDGTPINYSSSVNKVPLNQWTFFTVTRDNFRVRFYFNNMIDTEYNTVHNLASGLDVKLGWTASGWNVYFAGSIDDVHVYSQSLSQSQIQQHYAEGLRAHNLASLSK